MNYYGEERTALKANLHPHTAKSDGQPAPEEVIRRYAEAGCDVLSLTDRRQVHDISTYGPRGMIPLQGGEFHPENPGRMRIAKRDPEELKKSAGIINRAELDLNGMRTGDNYVRCHIRDLQERHARSNPIYL